MTFPPVQAKRLHEHALRIGPRPSESGSLFPFFDRDGAVSHLMVMLPHTPEVYAFHWRAGRVTVPPVGAVRIGDSGFALDPLDEQTAHELATLWHYDPWRVLTEPRYRDYWAVPMLKATNAVTFLEKRSVTSMCFARDLSRTHTVALSTGDDATSQPWNPAWVPESVPEATQAASRGRRRRTWRLDPIWDRRRRGADFG